jgi:ABC-type polysaccharide transport system permease subunit
MKPRSWTAHCKWQQIMRITVPLLRPTVTIMVQMASGAHLLFGLRAVLSGAPELRAAV